MNDNEIPKSIILTSKSTLNIGKESSLELLNNYKIYAIDFDDTLCKNQWPEIGEPIQEMIDYCIKLREQGHKLILWTCRRGDKLQDAVKWCEKQGLFFHAINENLPEIIGAFNGDCRKIFADYYIDDRNLNLDEMTDTASLPVRKINILGTEYSIVKKSWDDDPKLKRNSWGGYCSSNTKQIVLLDLMTEDHWKDETDESRNAYEKETLRHEIIHAFFNESGLQDNGNNYDGAWPRNEAMVDWIALQSPKIFKVFSELGIL